MKKHLLSFMRSPLGYAANFLASAACYGPRWLDGLTAAPLAWACETFARKDDPIQWDQMF